MKLDRKTVEKIAHLSRIELTEDEKKKFQKELSSILDYVEQLNEVNTENVTPTHQVTGLENVWREDDVMASDSAVREEILNNFPDRKKDLLRVPQIFS